MQKNLIICAAAACIRLATVCVAEKPAPYDLDSCIDLGLERNVLTSNARREQDIAREIIRQARSEALPHLSLNAAYTREDELQEVELGDRTIEMGVLDNYSASAQLNQALYSGGRIRAAIKAAHATQEYADLSGADITNSLVRTIRGRFYDILLARETANVRRESVAQLKSLLEQTEARFDAGQASDFDVISARVRLANAEPELVNAENTYRLAVEDMKKILDIDEDTVYFEGELTCRPLDTDLEELERITMANNPAIKAMAAAVFLKKQDVAAATSGYKPKVDLSFSYYGANSINPFEDEFETHWNAGVVMNWDIWDSNLTRGKVAEKKLLLDIASAEFEDLKKQVLLGVKKAYLAMQHARKAEMAGRDNVKLARKALDIMSTRHKEGMATYLEFTDADLALRTAQLSRLKALRDHMDAVAELHYMTGFGKAEKIYDEEK